MLFIVAEHFSRKNFATIWGKFFIVGFGLYWILSVWSCLHFNAVWKGTWYPNKAGNLTLLKGHTV